MDGKHGIFRPPTIILVRGGVELRSRDADIGDEIECH